MDRLDGRSLQDLIDQPGSNKPLCESRDGAPVPLSMDGRARK